VSEFRCFSGKRFLSTVHLFLLSAEQGLGDLCFEANDRREQDKHKQCEHAGSLNSILFQDLAMANWMRVRGRPKTVTIGQNDERQKTKKPNALRDNLSAIPVMNEKMDVVGSSHVIEDDNTITFPGLKKPVEPALPILGKLQKKFLLVTTMCEVPHMTRYVVTVCSWHVVEICLLLSLAISMAN
jgi:hypothetical protein